MEVEKITGKRKQSKKPMRNFLNPASALSICEDFEKFILLVHQCLDIFFRCGDRGNAIIFPQIVQNIWRQERRKRRAKTDVFDTQV